MPQPRTVGVVYELLAGRYSASVSPVGAALASLTFDDRPLVLDTRSHVAAGQVPMPAYSGAVLAPWPNRIRDGRYRLGDTELQLPITEVERGCALHGLLAWTRWTVVSAGTTALTLEATVNPQPGYPFTVTVTAEYELTDAGLDITISARNDGPAGAPFGTSIHPYLVPGVADGDMDDWLLTVAADAVLEVEPERLLPRSLVPTPGTAFDFGTARPLTDLALDHAFRATPTATATVTGPDGFGVVMSWDERSPWVQVCTIDLAPGRWRRSGLAVEPMTCPPDAFNSGTDVWMLQPGQQRGMAMQLRAEPGPA